MKSIFAVDVAGMGARVLLDEDLQLVKLQEQLLDIWKFSVRGKHSGALCSDLGSSR